MVVVYADDVMVVSWGPSRAKLETSAIDALSKIAERAKDNKIEISQQKSQAITFGNPSKLQRSPIFKINNSNIKNVQTISYLGILIDKNLSLLPHIKKKQGCYSKRIMKFPDFFLTILRKNFV